MQYTMTVQNWQEHTMHISFWQLGDCTYISTGCPKIHRNIFPKFRKSELWI